MNIELLVGVVSSAIAILLLFVGLPRKGVSPSFLRTTFMETFFPVIVLLFLVFGVAELIAGLT
jgi:hypothetical protein